MEELCEVLPAETGRVRARVQVEFNLTWSLPDLRYPPVFLYGDVLNIER